MELSHERLIKLKIEWSVAGLDQQIEDLRAEQQRIEARNLTAKRPSMVESAIQSQQSSSYDVNNELEHLQRQRDRIIQKLEKRFS